MYNIETLIASISYCGLICKLCFLEEKCDGCRIVNIKCERNCSDKGCYQRNCCIKKNYEGCWECNDVYKCEEGIYSLGRYSKVKAFATCIREEGKKTFIRYVLDNMKKGWSVEKGKDYDNKPIEEVLKMLRGK